ncbi:MAG: CRISPR-associated helicase Cas3' [Deltaproteobacteria bacterium]|nr:CRISPR-associated helicase Cas3' [Deltaproteobacteria bacterium]
MPEIYEFNDYSDFFKEVTGKDPFPWQKNLGDYDGFPDIINIPTGLGKTAAVITSWIYKRNFSDFETRIKTPRRLIYCLPMRVLVEQTVKIAQEILFKINLNECNIHNREDINKVAVYTSMGGEIDNDWDSWPEFDSIIVGTQDMLLSRALNRGYSMSPYRWPIHMGLLNNDSLWIFDEIQLMGSGLQTSSQLEGFRNYTFKTIIPSKSIWMSATINHSIDTIDNKSSKNVLNLSEDDSTNEKISKRINAKKINNGFCSDYKMETLPTKIIEDVHEKNTLTLVILNTVKRAQILYEDIIKLYKKNKTINQPEIILLHSRFRPPEKNKILDKLTNREKYPDLICISTQVSEAGIDISSKNMVSDVSSWSSMIQRLGRLNRYGEYDDSGIYFIEPDTSDKKKCLPYNVEEIIESKENIDASVKSTGIFSISNIAPPENSRSIYTVLRKIDLIELFDTSPDLTGMHVDVSPFIRENDDRNLTVFYRDTKNKIFSDEQPAREELVSVPVEDLKNLKAENYYIWDLQDGKWIKGKNFFPGMILMLDISEGGYSTEKGFTGTKKDKCDAITTNSQQDIDHDSSDFLSCQKGSYETIAEHTEKVLTELSKLIDCLNLRQSIPDEVDDLILSAKYHDWGKSHKVFQNAIQNKPAPSILYAKAPRNHFSRYERKGFRHELVSGFAMLDTGKSDLSAYLAVAHHGKVRLSVRSLPDEYLSVPENIKFSRGVFEGDELPRVNLTSSLMEEPVKINLSYLELGENPVTGLSWLARVLKLREKYGPFKLCFLESLLRISDWRASR